MLLCGYLHASSLGLLSVGYPPRCLLAPFAFVPRSILNMFLSPILSFHCSTVFFFFIFVRFCVRFFYLMSFILCLSNTCYFFLAFIHSLLSLFLFHFTSIAAMDTDRLVFIVPAKSPICKHTNMPAHQIPPPALSPPPPLNITTMPTYRTHTNCYRTPSPRTPPRHPSPLPCCPHLDPFRHLRSLDVLSASLLAILE
jgi:hypothetical protein